MSLASAIGSSTENWRVKVAKSLCFSHLLHELLKLGIVRIQS
jgi:hypothetical protein